MFIYTSVWFVENIEAKSIEEQAKAFGVEIVVGLRHLQKSLAVSAPARNTRFNAAEGIMSPKEKRNWSNLQTVKDVSHLYDFAGIFKIISWCRGIRFRPLHTWVLRRVSILRMPKEEKNCYQIKTWSKQQLCQHHISPSTIIRLSPPLPISSISQAT